MEAFQNRFFSPLFFFCSGKRSGSFGVSRRFWKASSCHCVSVCLLQVSHIPSAQVSHRDVEKPPYGRGAINSESTNIYTSGIHSALIPPVPYSVTNRYEDLIAQFCYFVHVHIKPLCCLGGCG